MDAPRVGLRLQGMHRAESVVFQAHAPAIPAGEDPVIAGSAPFGDQHFSPPLGRSTMYSGMARPWMARAAPMIDKPLLKGTLNWWVPSV